jgi:AAA+ superfamily predicted ATPase
MDYTNILMMTHFTKNNNIYITCLLLCMFYIKDYINNDTIIKYIESLFKKNESNIEIHGWEILNNSFYSFDYPYNMSAINYYIFIHNKHNKFKYFNNNRNFIYNSDDIIDDDENMQNYILQNINNIEVDNDIYVSLNRANINHSNNKMNGLNQTKINMILKSYKHNILYIQKFINKCIVEYDNYITNKNENKTYHFIYKYCKNDKLVFSSNILSDFNSEKQNYETFDNIFHKNKSCILADINKLHDIEYYKRTGIKHKKGYLFYGPPGTGKTSTVMAISNYDKRHIIEIPLSKLKTNSELEDILSLNKINNIKFKPNNIIILFDEIDTNLNVLVKNKLNSKENDLLNIGTLLSRLDGIGNYAGLIVIATTNFITNIDKALYRDGRLNLIEFKNADSNDIINILENYYETKVNDIQKEKINNISNLFSHSTIRNKLEYEKNIDDFIKTFIEML